MASTLTRRTMTAAVLLTGLLGGLPARAQLSQNMQDWMRRINAGEFGAGGRGGGGLWMDGGKAYAITEPASGGGTRSVRIDTATGARQVLPPEPPNTPPGGGRATAAGTSADGTKLLFSTNGHTVMIRKTASDYWVLDKADRSWHKLGGKSTAGLMFAKFSPDGKSVAYLGDPNRAPGAEPRWNLYVEDVHTGAVTQLTFDGSDDIIDGTSDWDNHEEFDLADCFLWSPDGRKIAYYQFDQTRCAGLRPDQLHRSTVPGDREVQISQAGPDECGGARGRDQRPAAARRVWLKTPGDPRNTYIPHMEWLADNQVILQHMNRLQNPNTVYIAEPGHRRSAADVPGSRTTPGWR